MRVAIDGTEYPFVPVGQWSYDEAAQVKRVTGCTVGQIPLGVMEGDAMASLAFAVVGFVRLHPDKDPMELRAREIDAIDVDFRDEEDEEGPPAEGAAADADGATTPRGKSPQTS